MHPKPALKIITVTSLYKAAWLRASGIEPVAAVLTGAVLAFEFEATLRVSELLCNWRDHLGRERMIRFSLAVEQARTQARLRRAAVEPLPEPPPEHDERASAERAVAVADRRARRSAARHARRLRLFVAVQPPQSAS